MKRPTLSWLASVFMDTGKSDAAYFTLCESPIEYYSFKTRCLSFILCNNDNWNWCWQNVKIKCFYWKSLISKVIVNQLM